jgi:hypothetical protein
MLAVSVDVLRAGEAYAESEYASSKHDASEPRSGLVQRIRAMSRQRARPSTND